MNRVPIERLERWERDLRFLADEIEAAVGEPAPGHYDDKLATLARFAAEEAAAKLRQQRHEEAA